MKKNIQNRLNELKENFVALLSSNKLKAAILATMALALAACDNGSSGSDNPYVPPYEEESPNPPDTEDPTKDVASRTLNSISATHNGTSAKSLDDILDNTTFTINYNVIYTDGKTDTNITEKVGYTKLRQYFNEDVVSFSVNGDFSETNQTVDLIITYNDNQFTLSGIKNGNYKDLTNPSAKTVVGLLKEIIGEADYDAISAEVAAGNMTLTAEKIKAVGDRFPALEKDAESGKEAKDVENADIILQNKEAFVAQAEGKINITKSGKYALNSYNISVIFNGEFNLDEISLPANNSKGDFSNATLTNNGNDITIDDLNSIRGKDRPILSFKNISSSSNPKAIYDLYKAYSDELGNLKLNGTLSDTNINGKEISGRSDYTLFTDNNEAKLSNDPSIISLSADALAQMTNQLKIKNIWNMIISGEAKTNTVNWLLTNIVFEGNMSQIKNTLISNLYGIVYFKDKPYNNNVQDGQSVEGMVKLDNLDGVSKDNFKVGFASNVSNVLDVSGISPTVLDKYVLDSDKQIASKGGTIHAIYFNENYTSTDENKIKELCEKFANPSRTGAINVYLGNKKVHGNKYNNYYKAEGGASRTPRTLKEFEYFGDKLKFEKSAKSSYDKYLTDWDALDKEEQDRLTTDDGKNKIAQNNKRIEFIDPETEKIIFSVVNDRQYNA